MKSWIIRMLGLQGSWKWACRQMNNGYTVRRATDTGDCKYRLDFEHQRRIVWTFKQNPSTTKDWENANIFLSDFEYTKWERV